MDEDLVFAVDNGTGERLKVFVTGPPENYRVLLFNTDKDALVGVAKCDWERIVQRVAAQFT